MELAALGFRFLLGFVFIAASIPKLAASTEFANAVGNYGLVPRRLVQPVARWLPKLELAAGLSLLFGIALGPVALLVAAMLLVFSGAVTWNLLRGRRIECGCAGTAVPRAISWPLVARDLLLASFAFALAFAAPDTAALLPASPLYADGVATKVDAMALMLTSALVVVAEALVVDALRTRSVLHAFGRAEVSP
jgi:hypothetical protein